MFVCARVYLCVVCVCACLFIMYPNVVTPTLTLTPKHPLKSIHGEIGIEKHLYIHEPKHVESANSTYQYERRTLCMCFNSME